LFREGREINSSRKNTGVKNPKGRWFGREKKSRRVKKKKKEHIPHKNFSYSCREPGSGGGKNP